MASSPTADDAADAAQQQAAPAVAPALLELGPCTWHAEKISATSEGRGAGKGKGKGKGKAAGAPRQGDSEAARRVDALESGDYGGAGLGEEEEDLAERFTRCLLEDASGGY